MRRIDEVVKYISALKEFRSDLPLGAVIWVGAGSADGAELILECSPERLILIEADPALASNLNSRYRENESIYVDNLIVSSDTGTCTFYKTNPPAFSSLNFPSRLVEYYPNAAIEKNDGCVSQSASTVIQAHIESSDSLNVLILQLNGAEVKVLNAFDEESLGALDLIFCDLDPHQLYGDAVALDPQKFDDFKNSYILLNGKKACMAYKRDYLGEKEREFKLLEQKNVALEQKVHDLDVSLCEITEKKENYEKLHLKNKKWAESLLSQGDKIKRDIEEKDRALILNQKMFAKAQIDIEHLRGEYQKKVESEKEMVDLVSELREKLALASKYYLQVQREHPELLKLHVNNDE